MNRSKHSQETLERLKANSEAAKQRLARLNHEYLLRQEAIRKSRSKNKSGNESFGEAVARIARENQLAI